MDSRQPPDTNVVRLRRNGEVSDEERTRLANTIFAEEDEVGTFSRGNLVPPKPTSPPSSDEPSVADPFFEELQKTSPPDVTGAAAGTREPHDTASYFERLGSQTPAEMSQSIAPLTAPAAMPGSASLPGEVATSRRRRLHRRVVSRPPFGRPVPIPRIHIGALPLLGALGVLLAVGAALAAILGGAGHGAPAAATQLDTQRASTPPSHNATSAIPPLLVAARSHSSARYHAAVRRTAHKGRRHHRPSGHIVLAADHGATRAASSSSAAMTPVSQSSSQTTQTSSVTQQSANSTPVAETASGSGSSAGSGGSKQTAFGANGTLGPGHSPNG
jgi:hypothetical protein